MTVATMIENIKNVRIDEEGDVYLIINNNIYEVNKYNIHYNDSIISFDEYEVVTDDDYHGWSEETTIEDVLASNDLGVKIGSAYEAVSSYDGFTEYTYFYNPDTKEIVAKVDHVSGYTEIVKASLLEAVRQCKNLDEHLPKELEDKLNKYHKALLEAEAILR